MIRQANQNDLDQLSVLFDQYRVFYGKTSDIPGARRFLDERMANNDSVIYVAGDLDGLKGFTQLYPLFSSVRMKRLWLLNDLFVNEKFRGQRISMGLIEEAKKLCRETNACGILLETTKTNSIGNQLYPRAGFRLNSESNFYEWSI